MRRLYQVPLKDVLIAVNATIWVEYNDGEITLQRVEVADEDDDSAVYLEPDVISTPDAITEQVEDAIRDWIEDDRARGSRTARQSDYDL